MAQQCLSSHQLQAYLNGAIDDETASSIELHLYDCDSCEQLASDLESRSTPDGLVRTLQLKGATLPEPSWVQRLAVEPSAEPFAEARRSDGDEAQAGVDADEPTTLGDYVLDRVLGRGGMSIVFAARHRHLQRDVAVKVLARTTSTAICTERFAREMRAIAALDHPAIVRATDAGRWQQTWYLVMELVQGADAGRLSRQSGPMSIADGCEIVKQAAMGLQHAHALGIVHRDIKPSNLMVDTSGAVKILDFGLARAEDTLEGELSMQTSVGQLLGTLDYMAPEQANCSDVGKSADIYALGATLFKLLTGAPPHGRSTEGPVLDYLRRLATEPAPDIRQFRPDVPNALADVLQQLLARDPGDRLSDAAAAADALDPFTSGAQLAQLVDAAAQDRTDAADHDMDLEAATSWLSSGDAPDPNANANANAMRQTIQPMPPSKPPIGARKWVAWLGGAALLLLAGITLFVQTNVGQLKIEADESVEVSVRRAKDGEEVKSFQTSQADDHIRIRTGAYEIQLKSKANELTVTPERVVVRRGGQVVVRVQRQPAGEKANPTPQRLTNSGMPPAEVASNAPGTNAMQPTYDGKPADHWLQVVKYERSPELRRAAANNALQLADAVAPERTHDFVMDVLPTLLERSPGPSPEGLVGEAMYGTPFVPPRIDNVFRVAKQPLLAKRLVKMLAGDTAEQRAALWTAMRLRQRIRNEAGWEELLQKISELQSRRDEVGNAAFAVWAACSPKASVEHLSLESVHQPEHLSFGLWTSIAHERQWQIGKRQQAEWVVWSVAAHGPGESYFNVSPPAQQLMQSFHGGNVDVEFRNQMFAVSIEHIGKHLGDGPFHAEQNRRYQLLTKLAIDTPPSETQRPDVVKTLEQGLKGMLAEREHVQRTDIVGVDSLGKALTLLTGKAPAAIQEGYSEDRVWPAINLTKFNAEGREVTLWRELYPLHYAIANSRVKARGMPIMVLAMAADLQADAQESWLTNFLSNDGLSDLYDHSLLVRYASLHPHFREMLARWVRGGAEHTQLALEVLFDATGPSDMIQLLLVELDNPQASKEHLRVVLRLLYNESRDQFAGEWAPRVAAAISRVDFVKPKYVNSRSLGVEDFIYYLSRLRSSDARPALPLVEKYLETMGQQRMSSIQIMDLEDVKVDRFSFAPQQLAIQIIANHPDRAHYMLTVKRLRPVHPAMHSTLIEAATRYQLPEGDTQEGDQQQPNPAADNNDKQPVEKQETQRDDPPQGTKGDPAAPAGTTTPANPANPANAANATAPNRPDRSSPDR